jgi:hypothetical protein
MDQPGGINSGPGFDGVQDILPGGCEGEGHKKYSRELVGTLGTRGNWFEFL